MSPEKYKRQYKYIHTYIKVLGPPKGAGEKKQNIIFIFLGGFGGMHDTHITQTTIHIIWQI